MSALETVGVSPTELSLKKGESKNLTLTGKNLRNAKSALVFLKNSPKKEFATKLSCKGATRCVVSLTLKGQVAQGSYSVKLLDAKKKPIAEGQFKLSPPSGKSIPKSSRALKSKPKGTPPSAAKAVPRSSRELKTKSKPTPPAGKAVSKSSREIRSQLKQAPPKSTRPRLPEKTGVIPSSIAELAGIKLTKQKAAPGEVVKGTVILTGKAPSPNGVRITLSSSDSKMAEIKPVQIRAGLTKANFSFKAGSTPGTVIIKAVLGKTSRTAKLVVIQAPFRSVTINKGTFLMTGRRPAPFRSVTINKGTFLMTGRRPAPFRSVTISKGTFLMTGRRPAPFRSVTIDKGTFLMTGRRPAPFTPVTIDKGTFLMTGRRIQNPDSPLFTPLTFELTETLRMTGRGEEPAQSPDIPPFSPVIIDPGTLQMTGRRPVPFNPVVIDPGTLQMTGRRPVPFSPVVIDPGTLQMTGRRPVPFSPVVIDPGTLQMTGRRPVPFSPVVIDPGTFEVTGRRFSPVTINPGTFEVTGRRFSPVTISPGTFEVTGRRGEPSKNQ